MIEKLADHVFGADMEPIFENGVVVAFTNKPPDYKAVIDKINELVDAVNGLSKILEGVYVSANDGNVLRYREEKPTIVLNEERQEFEYLKIDTHGRLLLKCPECQKEYESEMPIIK
jgi:hypothetical protein